MHGRNPGADMQLPIGDQTSLKSMPNTALVTNESTDDSIDTQTAFGAVFAKLAKAENPEPETVEVVKAENAPTSGKDPDTIRNDAAAKEPGSDSSYDFKPELVGVGGQASKELDTAKATSLNLPPKADLAPNAVPEDPYARVKGAAASLKTPSSDSTPIAQEMGEQVLRSVIGKTTPEHEPVQTQKPEQPSLDASKSKTGDAMAFGNQSPSKTGEDRSRQAADMRGTTSKPQQIVLENRPNLGSEGSKPIASQQPSNRTSNAQTLADFKPEPSEQIMKKGGAPNAQRVSQELSNAGTTVPLNATTKAPKTEETGKFQPIVRSPDATTQSLGPDLSVAKPVGMENQSRSEPLVKTTPEGLRQQTVGHLSKDRTEDFIPGRMNTQPGMHSPSVDGPGLKVEKTDGRMHPGFGPNMQSESEEQKLPLPTTLLGKAVQEQYNIALQHQRIWSGGTQNMLVPLAADFVNLTRGSEKIQDDKGLGILGVMADNDINAPQTISSTPTVSMTKPAIAELVARQIAEGMRIAANPQTVQIELDPAELGRVRLNLTPADGAMALTVVTDRADTSELLRRNIEILAEEFRQLGYSELTFSFQHEGETGSEGTSHDQPHDGEPKQGLADSATAISDPTAPHVPLGSASEGVDIRI
ncbi:flagellar hook-length control protein FliK [Algirhabdus cladophorae]|uniref:flagellar hook-length control protein FliK n=1 Tax=Algirhabdus cladophorae TaxID=3377108 RepID=UPI003B849E62